MNGGTDQEAGRTWIVSFADLLSLLLSFMVMIFAVSSVDHAAPGEPIEPLAVDTLAEGPGRNANRRRLPRGSRPSGPR